MHPQGDESRVEGAGAPGHQQGSGGAAAATASDSAGTATAAPPVAVATTKTTTTIAATTAAPATNNNGVLQMNLDHYKYLRTLLPTIPHVIDSLCVSDANSWECTIYAALLTESDCLKWLIEFQDNTKTDWKAEVDNDLRAAAERHKQLGVASYGNVYRCVGSAYQDAGGEELIRKKCPAKMEIKILNIAEVEKKGKSKQYPCQVHISFYHNHTLSMTINGGLLSTNVCSATATAVAEFKVQQQLLDQATTSSTLKDQYEYFLPNNNLGDAADHATTAVSLSAIQPPPLHHGHRQQQQQQQGLTVILPQQHLQTPYQAPTTVVFDLEDVSRKLDCMLSTLKVMLKKTGTSCAAVKQFTDQFDSLRGDKEAMEAALCNFGRSSPVSGAAAAAAAGMTITTLEAPQVPLVVPPDNAAAAAVDAASLLGQHESLEAIPPGAAAATSATFNTTPFTTPAATTMTISTPHWTMTPVLPQDDHAEIEDITGREEKITICGSGASNTENQVTEAQQSDVGTAVSDAVAKTLKKLKTRRKPKMISNVLPGMIDPVTGKRRKRSRCGSCLGCINRDKTQDCRVCRNCIDQKRYGGPGRLKKACVKRSCIIMATQEGLEPILAKSTASKTASLGSTAGSSSSTVSSESPPVQEQHQVLDGTTIALPIHPLPVATTTEEIATSVTMTLPQQPVTLTARTTTATAVGSQLAASAPRRIMTASSTSSLPTAATGTAAAVLSWPNGTEFAPTFQVRKLCCT